MKRLGERIRELRAEKNLSLRDLSRQVSGASASFLSDVEQGRRFPSEKTLVRLARALETTVEELTQFDSRLPIDKLQRMIRSCPALGHALRRLAEKPIEVQLRILNDCLPLVAVTKQPSGTFLL